jgi:hypothetical protein
VICIFVITDVTVVGKLNWIVHSHLFRLPFHCVDCNNGGINYRQIQLVYIVYFIVATCLDPVWSYSGQ